MAGITYEGDIERSEPAVTTLFGGKKLWFSLAVPARSRLMKEAEQNGAQIVQLEQQADVKLVDHAKSNQAPGTYSYRYVDFSIRNGTLEDLESHRVGSASRVDRPVGSVVTASKGGRNRFTDAEDQLLWDWVKPLMDTGGAWKGNEIYKQLERSNPAHTFQSWRDRWIKHTQFQKRQTTTHHQNNQQRGDQVEVNPRSPKRRKLEPPTQTRQANIGIVHSRPQQAPERVINPTAMGNTESKTVLQQNGAAKLVDNPDSQQLADATEPNRGRRSEQQSEVNVSHVGDNRQLVLEIDSNTKRSVADGEDSVSADGNRLPLAFDFTQSEALMLYRATPHILDARPDKLDESWAGVAQQWGHTKDTWRIFFKDVILPEYRKRHQIHTDEQQEAHVRAYIVNELARKESERATGRKKRKAVTSIDGDSIDTVAGRGRLQKQREAQEKEGSWQSTYSDQVAAPTAAADHRPPQPNESRKLSQEKSPQSTSSQPKARSISQLSQNSQTLAPIREASALSDKSSLREPDAEPSVSQLHEHPEPNQQSERDTIGSMSQAPEEHEDFSSRFVTQASYDHHSSNTESSLELQDIPYEDPTPVQPSNRLEDKEIDPEEDWPPSDRSKTDPDQDVSQELLSSLPSIHIADGENEGVESLRPSSYAPSETLSQEVQFQSQIRLSQAWETAPENLMDDGRAETDNEERYDGDKDLSSNPSESTTTQAHEFVNEKSTSAVADPNDGVLSRETLTEFSNDSVRNKSTEDDFETAPMSPRTETTPSTTMPRKLDTQALFRQPTQIGFHELAAIPEPLEGWDDEVQETDDRGHHTLPPAAEDIDWTLPLPDPEVDDDNTTQPALKEGESDDVESWLSIQSTTYPSIPALLLNPLSHRALHTTSMDLALATTVIASMVQRFSKGKHPAHQSLEDIQGLPKRKRKDIVAGIIEDLVPSQLRGCWTNEDDQALLGVNGREVKRVEDKHGEEDVQNRFAFLEMWHKVTDG